MIKYSVFTKHPHRHFISFSAEFEVKKRKEVLLQLPSWRPGRYELGNFAKNIRAWKAVDEKGTELRFRKTSKDAWLVQSDGANTIVLTYQYYAAELNAGSSFLDEDQLYINPVNCFFYDSDFPGDKYEIKLHIPDSYKVASGLSSPSKHVLTAHSFDELADCPLIASATIKHVRYEMGGVPFNIWIQGDVNLNDERLVQDFEAFTKTQLDLFGDIPCKEYHFLYQFVPYFLRHGVEHSNSTVITMGPAADFQQEHLYKDLLGISCHELFHTWNVKNIRPVEMMPYDFTRENYSEQGYVYEGVTTYYGDSLLWRSGAFTQEDWLEVIDGHIQDYVSNHGRLNLSVAQSSWDTWLDGYVAGIPWRKVSIYNEGFLVALMCDLLLLQHSKGTCALDVVMKRMYERFGKKAVGYTAEDYWSLLNECGVYNFDSIYKSYILGTKDYMSQLREVLGFAGVQINFGQSGKWGEAKMGVSIDESNLKCIVSGVAPHSPADDAGLWYGDEIISVNGHAPYKNIHQLLKMFASGAELTVMRKGARSVVNIAADGACWLTKYRCSRVEEPTEQQEVIWKNWNAGVVKRP
ncbi:MAG: M61 family metallopeptidase [Flavobacteriales bacterium]